MALQEKISNLKEGPKDDKVAVASGIAISVVAVLLVAWAIFFFRGIAKGTQEVDLSGGAQDEFNFSSVKEAQERLKQEYSDSTEEFQQIREEAVSRQIQLQLQTELQQTQGSGSDQFGSPNTTY
ncbi:hypothetical protein A3C18_04135 [Candidatus Kaiserbacteria bacterium RIFCSPHIGHO2_02_FULL_54_11b]|uniref:Uncharacterized protein n=2 Tax=Candidatus Kaiseribacteriota TaxID=1752734 RepID=A0A1F6CS68_9BACT|nr:MAG: hypothetical protein A2704_00630 [Candidatus Kaiserbacteria bacterium RIFCSPHIGHO2_01_FULL_54_36b]OGG64898.1 MAG: hypothetical protein A3C18_04135 [Candidatus Kaiserbacteria bacterium RIFCSPHIGHO2_02_FULL_54_11b]